MKRLRLACIAAVLLVLPLMGVVNTRTASAACSGWTPNPLTCMQATQEVAATSTPERPLVFGDDFDTTGDLSLWNGLRELKVETKDVYSGKFAMRATSTGTPITATTVLPKSYEELYYRVRFKVVSQGSNSVYLMRLRSKNSDAIIGFFVSNTGGLGFRNDITGATFTSTTVIPTNEWNRIQIRVKVNGRDSQISVWLNGDPIDSLGQTLWLGTSPIRQIELGESSGGRTFDIIFDDVAVDTEFIPSDRGPDPIDGVLTIQTSPVIPNVPFVLDGRTFYSDAKGVAHVEIARWSTDLRTRITVPETVTADGRRIRLSRWFRWSDSLQARAVAAFEISVPVTWSFENLQAQPVDPKLVQSITFKSSTGVKAEFKTDDTGNPQYLLDTREIATQAGLETKSIYYTVEQVMVNGSNVVIKSRNKFFPGEKNHVTIPLMFYSAQFRSKDTFFGFATGKEVKLVAPDGTIMLVPIKDGEVFIPALARGQYDVNIEGPGMSPPRPIAVSRNQDVELKVFSYLDMAVCAVLIGGFTFGLLFLGRPKLRSPRYVLGWVWSEVKSKRRGVFAR